MDLKGKSAVVTGAASGIGKATAEALAAAGAHVFLGDIAEAQGAEAAAAIRKGGQLADFVRLDVTDLASVEAIDIVAGYDEGIWLLREDEFLRSVFEKLDTTGCDLPPGILGGAS